MYINVKPLTQDGKSLEIPDNSKIADLLKVVENAFGVTQNSFRLVFKGSPLLDLGRALNDYRIRENDTVTLIAKSKPVADITFEDRLRTYFKTHFKGEDVDALTKRFLVILMNRLDSMSLNDIERLAALWCDSNKR